jgi:hypothetical protein
MRIIRPAILALFMLPALTACGGGGGSPPPTSAPTAVPTHSPVLASATGKVLDLGNQPTQPISANGGTTASLYSPAPYGPPIAGASVVVGPVLITGATPPPSLPTGDVIAKTAADGTYAVAGFDASQHDYVMVFPASGDTHVPLHEDANVGSGQIRPLYLTTLGNVNLDPTFPTPNDNELGLLNELNSLRASSRLQQLTPDEALVEAARYWLIFTRANNYFDYCIPGCTPAHNPAPAMAAVGAVDLTRYRAFGGLVNQGAGISGALAGVSAPNAATDVYQNYPAIYQAPSAMWIGPAFTYVDGVGAGFGPEDYPLVI